MGQYETPATFRLPSIIFIGLFYLLVFGNLRAPNYLNISDDFTQQRQRYRIKCTFI